MAALRTYDFGVLAVVNGDLISEKVTEGYVVSAIQPEFPSLKAFNNLSQGFLALVDFSLSFGHRLFSLFFPGRITRHSKMEC